ncbi:NAD-dependent epimerase/dehydratase family protein [Halomarina rubra]|uniref:NAD-dependent epimerase/dehydratase family protein n=1 Tax=Halomarina rubra TaxID=2071873 RepID=A0ABD6AXT2_9EURY|nr:NAD-dependent epimerase/dehydratase family protein [Halomarina rubra]
MTDTDRSDASTDTETPHVAVTGAAGYIGSRLVADLRREHPDWELTAVDNFYLGQVRSIGDLDIDHVDIRHREELEEALAGADAVVHLAAISGVNDCDEHPDRAYEVNVQGTENVAWFCRKTGAALAFPFSMAVIGDPTEFPITTDLPRDPLNWYGRTKVLNEQAIEWYADGAFPAHQFMVANLYGEHELDGQTISKRTVINIFANLALDGESLTVNEPGTQSRNFVHVKDVAQAFAKSVERLLEQRGDGETGVEKYEVATDEDPSVLDVAELVQQYAREERGVDVDVVMRENPRSGETLVDSFEVDWSAARDRLGWEPRESVEDSIRSLLRE